MNEQRGDCYYHPTEIYVGVCPLCLYERLLVLAAKQAAGHTKKGCRSSNFAQKTATTKPPAVVLPRIFALGSLLNRFEFRHHRKSDTCSSTASQDDSFISIQFENNGAASWEKNRVSKVSVDHCNMPWKNSNNNNNNNNNKQSLSKGAKNNNNKGGKTVIEHAKPRASSLRWRKRIGHVFQVMRWKRTNKGNVCHVGNKMEGVKVRNGWIRTLTKRRTKE